MRPVPRFAPGVSDRVDPHDRAEIAVGDHERKACDYPPPYHRRQGHQRAHQRARGRGVERCDERHGVLDRRVEPLSTARVITLVTRGRRVELDARCRR